MHGCGRDDRGSREEGEMDKMEKMNKGNLTGWVILGLLGILLIVGQKVIKDIFYIVMAIGLILAAVAGIVGWWRERAFGLNSLVSLLGNVVLLVIGIWILRHPSRFDTMINVMIGLVLIISGLRYLTYGWRLGRDAVLLAAGALALILGLVIALTNAATSWLVIAEGIGLIYTAVIGFIAEKRFA